MRRLLPALAVLVVAAALAVTAGLAATPLWAAPRSAPPPVHVGLGDSIASGHGLGWRDWLGGDPCWRDGGGYAARVGDRFRDATGGRTHLLACSGATADALLAPAGQLDQAAALRPTLVTLTIGANDLGFTFPQRFLPQGVLDLAAVDARLAALAARLDVVLARLLAETPAQVLVTGYHDPTAADPYGVDGCRRGCFRAAAAEVSARLNATIRAAVDRSDPSRARFVDVAPLFVGRGAPNGAGPDGWRALGVPRWVPMPSSLRATLSGTAATQAYCADGWDIWRDRNWVNGLDCVHPDADGARAYADAVWAARQG